MRNSRDRSSLWKKCGKCGRRQHESGGVCPALGKNCLNCGKENHFSAVCNLPPKVDAIEGRTNDLGLADSKEMDGELAKVRQEKP